MTCVQRLGRDDVTERDLFMIELDRIEDLPDDLQLPSRCFACLLAWDASGVSDDVIGVAARKLDKVQSTFVLGGQTASGCMTSLMRREYALTPQVSP